MAKTFKSAVKIESYLDLMEIAAPSTPSSGYGRMYVATDGSLHFKNDAGTDLNISTASVSPGGYAARFLIMGG